MLIRFSHRCRSMSRDLIPEVQWPPCDAIRQLHVYLNTVSETMDQFGGCITFDLILVELPVSTEYQIEIFLNCTVPPPPCGMVHE